MQRAPTSNPAFWMVLGAASAILLLVALLASVLAVRFQFETISQWWTNDGVAPLNYDYDPHAHPEETARRESVRDEVLDHLTWLETHAPIIPEDHRTFDEARILVQNVGSLDTMNAGIEIGAELYAKYAVVFDPETDQP